MRLALEDIGDQRRKTVGCSTPFGIYEVGTSGEPGTISADELCSTPFGIYEVGTKAPDGILMDSEGAQRLSASMRLAHISGEGWSGSMCVLNAFRHL